MAGAQVIDTRRTGEDSYELTLRSNTVSDVSAGQQLLGSTASGLCNEKAVRFGRYEFSLVDPVTAPSQRPQFLLKTASELRSPTRRSEGGHSRQQDGLAPFRDGSIDHRALDVSILSRQGFWRLPRRVPVVPPGRN
jgi:hypothetical protein